MLKSIKKNNYRFAVKNSNQFSTFAKNLKAKPNVISF